MIFFSQLSHLTSFLLPHDTTRKREVLQSSTLAIATIIIHSFKVPIETSHCLQRERETEEAICQNPSSSSSLCCHGALLELETCTNDIPSPGLAAKVQGLTQSIVRAGKTETRQQKKEVTA